MDQTVDVQGFVPVGKVWIQIHGMYFDDLFEIAASTADEEIAAARQQYKERYPNKAAFISIRRITHEDSKGHTDASTLPTH